MSNGGPRQILVYATGVDEHLLRGCSVSDEQIQAWADEAEAGCDLRTLPFKVQGRLLPGLMRIRMNQERVLGAGGK